MSQLSALGPYQEWLASHLMINPYNHRRNKTMTRIALLLALAAIALTWLELGAPPPLHAHARAQATGPDAIDPALPLALTEAINNHNPNAVQGPFVQGATVVFDNSMFGIPNTTLTHAQYAARQRPDQPDVPADIRLEVVDGSVQIGATRATWAWKETAGFLKDINVDYIEFSVVATTQDHRFKSLSIAPTAGSLAKLISLAPSNESLARLPYSPALPTLRFSSDGSIGPAPVVVRFESVAGSKVRGAAIVLGKEGGTSVSLHLTGMAPGTPVQAALHAGTCSAPGASFAALPELTPDASGTGSATGPVLFRGRESVALATVADGDHVISIGQSGRAVACARVPTLEGVPDSAPGMPRTGDATGQGGGQMMLLILAVMSVGLVFVGLRLKRARTLS
jgi:hypothetical protein